MATTQIDGLRQIQNNTVSRDLLVADFLGGSNLDLTNGNNNATITGLADGSAARDAVNKQQMDAAIAAALTGSMTYQGTIDASVATGIALDGAAQGDFFLVSVAGTLDGIAFAVGDHLVVNAAITDFDVDGSGKIDKVDNTESADILRDADIVDNLLSTDATKVLSANQGSVIAGLIDTIEASAGLSAAGAYVPDAGADYIASATSLANADSLLDDQIKANADAISALQTDRSERVFGEKPTVTNGSPTLAALANIPIVAGTARVYLNGMRMDVGVGNDYTINETTGVITFEFNLKNPKDVVKVDYEY